MVDALYAIQDEIESAIWGYLQINSKNIVDLDLEYDDIEELELEAIANAFLNNATIEGVCEGSEYWIGQMEMGERLYAKLNQGKMLLKYVALRGAISDSFRG